MKRDTHSYCDRALLLDYIAELFLTKNDYKNALKKRLKAVSVLEPYHTEEADQRTANLLSNLYNNLSNTYLLMKKTKKAAEIKNPDMAKQVLSVYENLVLEHEEAQTLDNGVCQMMYGAIALSDSKAKEAELYLLSAENIITGVMGTDNDYAKTVYLYLNNLYTRWQKPEQALAYKNKYLKC